MAFTEDAAKLGEVIREARKAKDYSQESLAEELGVKQPSVSAWESGRALPSIPVLSKLVKLLDLDGTDVLHAAAADADTVAACG